MAVLLERPIKRFESYMKHCSKCRQQNLCPHHHAQLYLEVPPAPMHFIVMNVIGKFKQSFQGHQYALTIIDILMNYTWCTPLHTKGAVEVVHT